MEKSNIQRPRKGMNRETHPSELQPEEYSMALNATIMTEDTSSSLIIQNETSNTLCSRFKHGFVVVGYKYDRVRNRTYFFLKNETTGCSEIGYINVPEEIDPIQVMEQNGECSPIAVFEEGMEHLDEIIPHCQYQTLISDYCKEEGKCTGCLNFDTKFPVKDVIIRHAALGDEIYFTDYLNPQRYLKVDYIEDYYTDKDTCEGEAIETCLQCDKLRIFPLYEFPCVEPKVIETGGALREGVYEVFIFWSDTQGDIVSDLIGATNPISIFDPHNKTKEQTSLDAKTSFSFSIDLDISSEFFEFYKVIVSYTSGNDPTPIYYDYGVFPVDNKKIVVSSMPNTAKEEFKHDIVTPRPRYEKAKGLEEVDGYLFQHGLVEERDINLQQVVNLMGSFSKWISFQAKEDLFADGINSAKYKGRMRDETYPESIQFLRKGGKRTSLFPLISRPPLPGDKEKFLTEDGNLVPSKEGDRNLESYLDDGVECNMTDRKEKWQFENTATSEGIYGCYVNGFIVQEYTETQSCVSDTFSIGAGTIDINGISDIASWINENREAILDGTITGVPDIKAALEGTGAEPCDIVEIDGCSNPTLIPEESYVEAVSVTGEEIEIVIPSGNLNSVPPTPAPTQCSMFPQECSDNKPKCWDEFINNEAIENIIEASPVWVKEEPTNTSCTTAIPVLNMLPATIHLTDKASETKSDLLTNITVTGAIGQNFDTNISSNVVWVEAPFMDKEVIMLEVTDVACNINSVQDINHNNKIRITVFSDCNATTQVLTRLIDLEVYNSSQRFIVLNVSDFPDGVAKIAIDSPIKEYDNGAFAVQPPCGCFSIVNRDVKFTTKVNYTSIDFAEKNVYELTCTREIAELNPDCDPLPFDKGKFAYVESTYKYPCNKDLYDSSWLKVPKEGMPSGIINDFKMWYEDSVNSTGTHYALNSEANFMDKNIRHFKYPDNKISPFMSQEQGKDLGTKAAIYPLGFNLDNDVINFFLDVAVENKIITQEERDSIIGYEMFRGDRRTQRSIIARGIASSVRVYNDTDNNEILYPNFPFNTIGTDIINNQKKRKDSMLTFHSPETLFEKPTLPPEITIDGYLLGGVKTTFAPLEDHPIQVVLGRKARRLATTLAALEVGLDLIIKIADWMPRAAGSGGGLFATGQAAAVTILQAAALAAYGVQSIFTTGKHRLQWLETLEGLGVGHNHGYIALGEANYNNFIPSTIATTQYRALNIRTYLEPGDKEVRDEKMLTFHKVNNFKRESSVFLKYKGNIDYLTKYGANYDNSVAQIFYDKTGEFSITKYNSENMRSVVPFITLKQYLPGQWNTVNTISWVPTNYCGELNRNNKCEGVFGGDVFISRLHIKKKFPIFRQNAYGLAPNAPFKYSRYINVTSHDYIDTIPKEVGFLDYKTSTADFSYMATVFPENKSTYSLKYKGGTVFSDGNKANNPQAVNDFYVTDKYKFLINYFSVPSFLVESEINCNYRYGRVGTESRLSDDFAPNVGNLIEWVQEKNVPMTTHEKFFYNTVFSKTSHLTPHVMLSANHSNEEREKLNNLENAVIYSERDDISNSLRSPWLNYKPNNMHIFSNSHGKLIDVKGLESSVVLFRFTDGYAALGVIDPIRDRVDGATRMVGIGHLFNEKAINFNKTDLGYGGSQHKEIISTPFGHFTVDAKRGQVFLIEPGFKGMKEISHSLSRWFKQQLPFKVLNYYPEINIDNSYNGIGLAMGWDEKNKRFLLTKKDYIPNRTDYYTENGVLYDISEAQIEKVKLENEIDGWEFDRVEGTKVFFKRGGIPYIDGLEEIRFVFEHRHIDSEGEKEWIDRDPSICGGSGRSGRRMYDFYIQGVFIQTIYLNNDGGIYDFNNLPPDYQPNNPDYSIYDRYVEIVLTPQQIEAIKLVVPEETCHIQTTIEWICKSYEPADEKCEHSQIDEGDIAFMPETKLFEGDEMTFHTCRDEPGVKLRCGIEDEEKFVELPRVNFRDFEEVSWTIGYSPLTETWISYYSYLPNYYISYPNHFQTGVNQVGSKKHGVWSHLPYLSSYQVFYGTLYPFMIEYGLTSQFSKSGIRDISYWLDVRKYTNRYDFSNIFGVGFNKAYIYNDFQNTGLLELEHQRTNDRSQILEYPKQNANSTSILQSEIEGLWSFNYLYNRIRNERSGLPTWLNDKVHINKEINHPVMNYTKQRLDRMRGDYFYVRLINDKESRFKFIFKSTKDSRDYYQ